MTKQTQYYFVTLLFLMSCAPSQKSMSLKSISDPIPKGEKQVFGYIELTKNDSNRVSIWNWCKHEEFIIERSTYGEFEMLGEVKSDLSKNPGPCLIVLINDILDSSEKSRYKIYIKEDGIKGPSIPIQYSTSDSTIYYEVEKVNKKYKTQN